jgi:carbonic anhydrase
MGDLAFSRRSVLWSATAFGAGLFAGGFGSWSHPAFAETAPDSPDAALQRLLDGNRRFTEGKVTGARRDLESLKAVAPKQQPFAAVHACADSRVPVEILFDQGFGEVFVTRVAGNVAGAENRQPRVRHARARRQGPGGARA